VTIRAALLAALVALAVPLAAQQPDTTRAHTARADSTHVDSMRAVRLETQVITGTRLSNVDERTPVQVNEVDMRTVAPGPASAAQVLTALPGVSLSDDQGTRAQPTLDVRGFTLSPVIGVPQGVSVFLDGVRINEPDAQEVNFDLIPMEAVQSAELVRGPDVLFGKNTLGGALLLTTARGTATPHVAADLDGGAFGYRNARITASGMANGLDGYLMASGSDEDGYRDAASARTRMVFANLGRKRDSSDVALSLLYAHDRLMEAGSLPESWIGVDRRANYTAGDFFEPELFYGALRGQRELFGGQLRGNLFARSNDIQQFNVNIDAPSTLAHIRNLSGGGTAELSLPTRLVGLPLGLTFGAEYSRHDVRYRIFGEATAQAPIDSTECDPATGLCENARVNEDDAALYAQGVLSVTDRLSLTAAARGDYVRIPFRDLREPANDGTSTFRRFLPKLGANYQFTDDVRGYAAVSTGFRAPAALELACADVTAPCPLPFALGDDPPLDPVTVVDYQGGIDWDFASGSTIDISTYRTNVRNDIVFVASKTTAGYFQNIPHTRRQGVEISGTLALPAGFRTFGSYSYQDATYQSTVQLASALPNAAPAEPGDRFPLSPAHRGTAGVGYTRVFPSMVFDGALSMRAVSSQFLRGDEANAHAPLPGYAVADLRLSLDARHYGVTARVSNLFNSRYDTFGIFADNPEGPLAGPPLPQPERWLTPGYPFAITLSLTVKP
jgi:outer membrane receptor protein involved in Fe transport